MPQETDTTRQLFEHEERSLRQRWQVRFDRLLGAALFLAGCGTVASYFGAAGWWLDLFTHFRLQYFVIFALAVVLAAWRRQRRGFAYLSLAILNCNAWPLPAPESSHPEALRVLLCNVNRDRGQPELVRDVIDKANPDVLVLLEVDASWRLYLERTEGNGEWHGLWRTRTDNFGIALLSRHPFSSIEILDLEPPAIAGTLALGDQILNLLAVHPPPPYGPSLSHQRDQQFENFTSHFEELTGACLLIGDLNASPWSTPRKRLRNATGMREGSPGVTTWPAALPWLLRIPIDSVLMRGPIEVTRAETAERVGSDHLPVIVELAVTR